MLELIIGAFFTIMPDYLYRRYFQKKRLGQEITLSNIWYELRWGLVAWSILTIVLLFLRARDEPSAPEIATIRAKVPIEGLPFFVTGPGEVDLLMILIAIAMVCIVIGLGALYFWIQAWPDRLAVGASKVQLQMVGILGLISLLTLNNAFWIAGLMLATIRFPDIVTPLKNIAYALTTTPEKKD